MATSTASKTWLKQHAANEKKLAKALESFFREQNKRIMAALGPHLLESALDLNFHVDNEAALMLAEIEPLLLGMMATAAADVISQAGDVPTSKAFSFGKFKLPASVVSAIQSTWETVKKKTWWADIQKNIKKSVTDAIGTMTGEGLGIPAMTKKLQKLLGGISKARASSISITECTGCMNAGHQAGCDYLATEGLVKFKRWESILDLRCRPTHVKAHGQYARAVGNFTVGGFKTPYPAWDGLPPEERVRCRCRTIAVLSAEESAAADAAVSQFGADNDNADE